MEILGDYELYTDRLLGSGSFSKVYLGTYIGKGTKYISPNKQVAIKVIEFVNFNKIDRQRIQDEIEILELIRDNPHPHIVECYDTIRTKTTNYIIMEYCDSGNLKSIIKKPIKEEWVQFYFVQLANGLRYLDKHNIVHRDFKPKNILLTGGRHFLKIADFGLAKILNQESLCDTMCGSPLYMAPEIMRNAYYNKKVDLWSIGWILFEMLYGYHPGNVCKSADQWREKLHTSTIQIPPVNNKNKDVSEECLSLLRKLLHMNSKNRMTWNDFFCHPWINQSEAHKPTQELSVGSLNSQSHTPQDKTGIIEDYFDTLTEPKIIEKVNYKKMDNEDLFELELEEKPKN